MLIFCIRLSFTGTISIPHFGQFPGVSLITSGCIVQVYFTAVIFFAVSVVDVVAVVSFLLSEELLPLQATKNIVAKKVDAMSSFFMAFIFYCFKILSTKI